MDAFQGCYKNGTNGTWDCRYFSVVYILVRISVFVVAAAILKSSVFMFFFLVGLMFTFLAILIMVMQPYKSFPYNVVETILFLACSLFCFCIVGSLVAFSNYVKVSIPNSINGLLICAGSFGLHDRCGTLLAVLQTQNASAMVLENLQSANL